LAGTPTTIAKGGTSFVTIEPAPTTAPLPLVIPGIITACVPIQTSSSITMGLEIVGANLMCKYE
jgi:hypothetical protein